MTIAQRIAGRSRDLGGFSVARVLPAPQRRALGPFVFFDEMGPAVFAPGTGIDVRPHPHIGLSTVTYLFEGGLTHRDSLGTALDITPGRGQLDDGGARHRAFGAVARRPARRRAPHARHPELGGAAGGARGGRAGVRPPSGRQPAARWRCRAARRW